MAALVCAAPALAADTFVDPAIGSDSNSCTSPGAACATIGAAIGKAGNGDTIRVGPGIYTEQVTLAGNQSLRATGTAASTVIDAPIGPTIDMDSTGTVQGFTIRGENAATSGVLRLGAPGTVRGNVFDETDNAVEALDIRIRSNAGSPTVTENTFADDESGRATAIQVGSTDAPTISDNLISGFFMALEVTEGEPVISRNTITSTHGFENPGGGKETGTSILIGGPSEINPTLTANYIHDPVDESGDGISPPVGVAIFDEIIGAGDPDVGATLRRNRVFHASTGVQVDSTQLPVTLDSDLIAGSGVFGLSMFDSTGPSRADVTATNVTLASNAFDISTFNNQLTLNSSIVEDAIFQSGTSEGCAISFSRGPTATPGGNGCQNFQTTDPPLFVNTPSDLGPDDYHLQDGSAMRDSGDPASPPVDARDFDGDLRMSASCFLGPTRRDIGADETAGASCIPPDTQIDSGPSPGGATAGSPQPGFPSPTFGFSTAASSPAFECAIDDGAFSTCPSPKSYVGLGGGSHTFGVRARDGTNQTADNTPATRAFTVDATPSDTQISSGPGEGSTTGPSTSFGLSSEPGATFECSLDRAAFSSCSSGPGFSGLSDGQHRLAVRSVDAVGNADSTAAIRSWQVDATPPETSIDSGPPDGTVTQERSVSYAFSSESGAGFECAVDGGPFAACTSPATLSDLGDGDHSFAVRATDALGNTDPSPAQRALRVVSPPEDEPDRDPPETTVKKAKVKGDDVTVKFGSDEPGSTFRCKLDKKPYKPCTSPKRYKNLDDRKHKVQVQAIDAAGNVDPSPATKKFEVEG